VAEGIGEAVWPELTGQIYYGDDEFIAELAKEAKGAEVPREQRQPLRPLLRECVKSGTPEEIGQAYREYGYRLREIAQHLGVHYATVSRRLKRAESQRSHSDDSCRKSNDEETEKSCFS
jgi:DNA-binding NtrC family response regulator